MSGIVNLKDITVSVSDPKLDKSQVSLQARHLSSVKNWIATVTLESSTYKYPDNDALKNARNNTDRMSVLCQITKSLANTYSGSGIILYPGGYFHSGTDEAAVLIPRVVDQIKPLLEEIYNTKSSSIVVCLGIDGKVLLEEGPNNRYDANQVSIAISKDGLIAFAKKFYPTDDIEARVVDLAADYMSLAKLDNDLYSRVFTMAGKSFYIAECNDIKGLRNYPKPANVDCILNCVHGCYNRDDGPTCSYFVRLNFAGASKDWKCPVFGAVVFFKRKIAEKWRTGMFYRMWDRNPIQCDTDENSLAPVRTDSEYNLDEGLAQVEVYDLDTVFSGNPLYREQFHKVQLDTVRKPYRPLPKGDRDPYLLTNNLYERIRCDLDELLGKLVIDQKSKITYKGKNNIGYPKRRELDMISLFKPSRQNRTSVKFRIYPYVLAAHLKLKDPDQVFRNLPEGTKLDQERENPHPGEVFIAGKFSNMDEIERFMKFIRTGGV